MPVLDTKGRMGRDGQGVLPGFSHIGYGTFRGTYDEMVDEAGAARPHWRTFVESLGQLSEAEMRARWERGQRLIRDNGVTYNVYGDPEGMDRPWQLDPLPLIINSKEWAYLETALKQRATLMSLILADLYGPQRLLTEGLLPPALVFANPAFLRPLHGAQGQAGKQLQFYAADVARSPDGTWWVVGDRTEAPSGAGYALENRIIVSRVLPDFYRTANVHRLAGWFLKARDALIGLSPRNPDNPRVVVLTPGPYNETYFEHAYLARYMGLTLVEGEDLTVRDTRVYLKTMEGLKPVEVILRRTDGSYCDPLDLRNDSTLGVPGLVGAVQAGTVAVANGLGSGLIESPAFMPFLPGLCRHLLGEELRMPGVASWWCGQEKERAYVLANLHRLAVRPAFTVQAPITDASRLSATQRARLTEQIKAAPYLWVAQEAVHLSTAPAWVEGRLETRAVTLRCHAVMTRTGPEIMPGGLCRTTAPGTLSLSMQHGGGSKDTWVLSDEPVSHVSLLRSRNAPAKTVRGSRDLPSRVADNTFWLGRYLERCEDTTRVLRAAMSRAVEGSAGGGDPELAVVLDLFTMLGHLPQDLDRHTPMAQDEAIRLLIAGNTDPASFVGLRGIVQNMQRVATVVRDRLSLDTWRSINRLSEGLSALPAGEPPSADEMLGLLNDTIMILSALSGLCSENMTRGPGWRFMDVGRRVERGLHSLDLLSALLFSPPDDVGPALDVVLDLSDSVMTYRARYLAAPQVVPVLDLLLVDETNPRSLGFQLARLMDHADALAPYRADRMFTPEQRIIMGLLTGARTLDPALVTLADPREGEVRLIDLIGTMRSGLWDFSETLTRQYFVHAAEVSEPLSPFVELLAAKDRTS
ncbi:circularly permuted type 2 ATP-grasp protein [Caenispirillum bisanense]|uniref:circularly permuted type 2 ATP-grasp protein n=1 Tax=Caenispirillum bisanense TaxID=414052 RepID=UPI0031DED840